MYVVLMAMLAMNISSEVLDGFSIVDASLMQSTANTEKQNTTIYDDFETQLKANPQKVREWFDKATLVKRMSDSLYNYAQQLKVAIVKDADGSDGDVNKIERVDDLEAANHVMLAPGTGQGSKLRKAIDNYREQILTMVTDEDKRRIIASNLTTKITGRRNPLNKNWEE